MNPMNVIASSRKSSVKLSGTRRRRDQAADEGADAEAEVVGRTLHRVGRVSLLTGRERREQARVRRGEAAVSRAGDRGEDERLPGRADEREAAVADGEQEQRGDERPARADPVDQPPAERARDEGDTRDRGDDDPRGREAEVPDVGQVDDQEREDDPVSERVGDTAGLEEPDGSGQLRVQAAQVRDDGIHALAKGYSGRPLLPRGETRSAPACARPTQPVLCALVRGA